MDSACTTVSRPKIIKSEHLDEVEQRAALREGGRLRLEPLGLLLGVLGDVLLERALHLGDEGLELRLYRGGRRGEGKGCRKGEGVGGRAGGSGALSAKRKSVDASSPCRVASTCKNAPSNRLTPEASVHVLM